MKKKRVLKNRMKELRKKAGYTQEDVAEVLQMKKSTYQGYERGERNIPNDALSLIANLYDVSIDELLMHRTQYILSDEEKILLMQYRNLNDQQKEITQLLFKEFSASAMQQTTRLRMAARSSGNYSDMPSEMPENPQELQDVPKDL